jgi:hypothetical protein
MKKIKGKTLDEVYSQSGEIEKIAKELGAGGIMPLVAPILKQEWEKFQALWGEFEEEWQAYVSLQKGGKKEKEYVGGYADPDDSPESPEAPKFFWEIEFQSRGFLGGEMLSWDDNIICVFIPSRGRFYFPRTWMDEIKGELEKYSGLYRSVLLKGSMKTQLLWEETTAKEIPDNHSFFGLKSPYRESSIPDRLSSLFIPKREDEEIEDEDEDEWKRKRDEEKALKAEFLTFLCGIIKPKTNDDPPTDEIEEKYAEYSGMVKFPVSRVSFGRLFLPTSMTVRLTDDHLDNIHPDHALLEGVLGKGVSKKQFESLIDRTEELKLVWEKGKQRLATLIARIEKMRRNGETDSDDYVLLLRKEKKMTERVNSLYQSYYHERRKHGDASYAQDRNERHKTRAKEQRKRRGLKRPGNRYIAPINSKIEEECDNIID